MTLDELKNIIEDFTQRGFDMNELTLTEWAGIENAQTAFDAEDFVAFWGGVNN